MHSLVHDCGTSSPHRFLSSCVGITTWLLVIHQPNLKINFQEAGIGHCAWHEPLVVYSQVSSLVLCMQITSVYAKRCGPEPAHGKSLFHCSY